MPLAPIEDAIAAIERGEMVILVDDEDRENEGDLVIAAEKVTAESINFMAKYGRGLICLSLTDERLKQLNLPMMVDDNSTPFGTAFTVSIEATEGVTTGISAADRARTIQAAVADDARPSDLCRPGHVFPLRARPGGVLARTGQTEGSVDLARLAGLKPAGVICEILNDDGTMARMPDLEVFAEEHGLVIVSVADLITYRLMRDRLVERVAEAPFPCDWGEDFRLRVYKDVDGAEHIVLIKGDPGASEKSTLVRVQHQNVVGDVFRGKDCDCGWQLHGAMSEIAAAEHGVFVYLYKQEYTRLQAIRRYVLKEDETAAELTEAERIAKVNRPHPRFREFGIGAQILADCGVKRMRVLNVGNPRLVGVESYGLYIEEIVPIPKPAWSRVQREEK